MTHLQYMLSVVSQFNSAVQEPPVSGVFGDTTTQAVTTFQRAYGLPETGTSRPRDVEQHLFAVCGHRDDRFRKRSALPVHASADGRDGG